jgi:hypothetical protein
VITSKSYYARRSLGVAAGAIAGLVFAVLTFGAAVWAGSRFGELLAGGRQVLVNNHGRIEVSNANS